MDFIPPIWTLFPQWGRGVCGERRGRRVFYIYAQYGRYIPNPPHIPPIWPVSPHNGPYILQKVLYHPQNRLYSPNMDFIPQWGRSVRGEMKRVWRETEGPPFVYRMGCQGYHMTLNNGKSYTKLKCHTSDVRS